MKRAIAALTAGCKSLRFVIQETVPQGPERDEALAMLRSIFYAGRDAIAAEADQADRHVDEYNAAEASVLGDRLCWDIEASHTSPTIRGTLVTVDHVAALLFDGWACEDILRTHPELAAEDIEACLSYLEFSKEYHIQGEKIAA